MSYTYLASPYTHQDPSVLDQRFMEAARAVHLLTTVRKITVYSPVVHFHEVAKLFAMPKDFAFWQKHNENMLEGATNFGILHIDGWEESAGIKGEYKYAKSLDYHCFAVCLEPKLRIYPFNPPVKWSLPQQT